MRIKLMTLCMALCCHCLNSIAQNVPDYVPTDGLVAWYPFNGNANDESGNGNDLFTFEVTYVDDYDGNTSSAAAFPNISSKCEVEVAPPLQEFESYSFSFRFRIDDPWSYNTFAAFTYGGSQYSGPDMAAFYWDENWFYGGCDNSSSGFRSRVHSHGTSYHFEDCVNFNTISQWRHIVMTFNDDTLRVYDANVGFVDFMEIESASADFSGSMLRVGTHLNQPQSSNAERQVDDLGVWNRELSAAEAFQILGLIAPIPGCTDSSACNFDFEATSDDGSCIPSGCMESAACNYNALAECGGEACDYSCCPGPGCCGEGTTWNSLEQTCESIPCETILDPLACGLGTYWDETVSQCLPLLTCQEDLDGDGVIGINDLMQLLSSFGTMCEEPETAEFSCGESMNYHGYDYATVQIGEQCWFAENLRNEHYANGDAIPGELSNNAWTNTNSGAQAIYNNDVSNFADYGRLYNWYAVDDARGLCPSGWHVATDGEFMTLEMELGMSESEANSQGWRGTDQGTQTKSSPEDDPSWNGTNLSGLSCSPAGYRYALGGEFGLESAFRYWSSTLYGGRSWSRRLEYSEDRIYRIDGNHNAGMSVRCIPDTEE